jgi:hypothetical protein
MRVLSGGLVFVEVDSEMGGNMA